MICFSEGQRQICRLYSTSLKLFSKLLSGIETLEEKVAFTSFFPGLHELTCADSESVFYYRFAFEPESGHVLAQEDLKKTRQAAVATSYFTFWIFFLQ